MQRVIILKMFSIIYAYVVFSSFIKKDTIHHRWIRIKKEAVVSYKFWKIKTKN